MPTSDHSEVYNLFFDHHPDNIMYDDVRDFLNNSQNICIRHAKTDKILGVIFFKKDSDGCAEIVNMVVDKNYRRCTLGTTLTDFLVKNKSYREVYITVNEMKLEFQLFLKSLGFKCGKVLKSEFPQNRDGYFFVHS